MSTQTKVSEAIADLIVINNDRHQGYKTASAEAKEGDLKTLFNVFSMQSNGFASDLRKFVPVADEQPKRDETKTTGKLYRAWMDVKSAITANDRKAILSSCEFGEDVAKKHYEDLLKDPQDIPSEALDVIRRQNTDIQKAHDRIKALRDSNV